VTVGLAAEVGAGEVAVAVEPVEAAVAAVEAVVVEVEAVVVATWGLADRNTNLVVEVGLAADDPAFVAWLMDAPVLAVVAENAGWGESVN